MHPFNIDPHPTFGFSLWLAAGTTPVDAAISAMSHEANGYFWEGVAGYLIRTHAPGLSSQVEFVSEGGSFYAHSHDRLALDQLGQLMVPYATSPAVMTTLIQQMHADGFDFDD